MAKRPLLSVAMIVKDEENNLPRCLESLKDFVDEIVIVDTGSVDRTVEIARKYTDKIYFYEWNNDFSAARNYSLQFPTGEWVFIVDADEEATEEMKRELRQFLENLPPDVNTVYLPTLSYLDWDLKSQEVASTPRIFRNGTVKYENIVHNQAVYKPKVVFAPYTLLHYGYIWTRKLKKKKYERTANLIREHLKAAKNDRERLYYLVQLYKTETVSGKYWSHIRVGWDVANLLSKGVELTQIAFEFFYIFGMELLSNDIEEGKKLLDELIRIVPEYPDPYCGYAIYYFNKQDFRNSYTYAKKYFEVLENVMAQVEKFTWTINSLKEKDRMYGILLVTSLFADDELNARKALEHLNEIDDIQAFGAFVNGVIRAFSEMSGDQILKYFDVLEKVLTSAAERRIVPNVAELVRTLALKNVVVPESLLNLINTFPATSVTEFLIRNRLAKPDVDFVYTFFMRTSSEEDFLDTYGIQGLVFLYCLKKDILPPEELLKWLHALSKKTPNQLFKGVIESFIGDTFLKMKNVRSALDYYKKAIRDNALIAKFIKPIVEDLKTTLTDLEIEGVADDLWKYYSSGNDFVIPLDRYPKDELQQLYLVSNHDFAKYVSAVTTDDVELKIKLLESISRPHLFANFYYHLAKAYENVDLEKAYALHIKAVEENENLADIKERVYKYTELYPAYVPNFYDKSDPKVWVGNISERFSCQGIIQPVRTWKRSNKGFYYVIPFPTKNALNLFLQREKQKYGKNLVLPPEELIEDLVSAFDDFSIRIVSDISLDNFNLKVFRSSGIRIDEKSKNVVVLSGLERDSNLGNLLHGATKCLVISAVPDPEDRESEVWYYPGFVFLREARTLEDEIRKLGYKIVYKKIRKSYLGIYAERVENAK